MNTNERLKQARDRLANSDAYYPSDSDMWPTALKNSIEDNRFLLALLDNQRAAVFREAIAIAENEMVDADSSRHPEDYAYNRAISDVIEAIAIAAPPTESI